MMDLIKCGKNLKEARDKKGIKPQELANRLGLSDRASIDFWENGKQSVPEKHCNKVASILDLAKSEFQPTIGYVYLFYYTDTKTEKNNTYPCKIGSTRQSVEHRVKWKVRTDWKEKREYKIGACIPLAINQCEAWEKMIHGVLMLRNRWINTDEAKQKGLKGKEWFCTSPDEMRAIYKGLQDRIKPLIKSK